MRHEHVICHRVVINAEGEAVSPHRAPNTPVDIIFIRNDNWCLGAPTEFEETAFSIWRDAWTHFVRKGGEVQPIGEYS